MAVPKQHHTILAVSAEGLPQYMQTGEAGLHAMGAEEAIAILDHAGAWFGPRGMLEEEPRLRQIIPYVVVRCEGKILTYTRPDTTGESRLASKSSFGFGGHVDISDYVAAMKGSKSASSPRADIAAVVERAMAREVAEELGAPSITPKRTVLGLLTDNTTPVDRVHIGYVEVWDIPDSQFEPQEDEVAQVGLKTLAELRAISDTLENWSRLTLDVLERAQ